MNSTHSYRIRDLRKNKGVSGTFVADKLGISPQYYYDIERGKKKLSAKMVSEIADIFETNTEYLLGRSDDPSPEIRQYAITVDGQTELLSSYETRRSFVISDFGYRIFELNEQRRNIVEDSSLDEKSKKNIIASLELQVENLERARDEFIKNEDSEELESTILENDKKIRDLGKLLSQPKVEFNGVELKKEDLQRILGFVEGLLDKK